MKYDNGEEEQRQIVRHSGSRGYSSYCTYVHGDPCSVFSCWEHRPALPRIARLPLLRHIVGERLPPAPQPRAPTPRRLKPTLAQTNFDPIAEDDEPSGDSCESASEELDHDNYRGRASDDEEAEERAVGKPSPDPRTEDPRLIGH